MNTAITYRSIPLWVLLLFAGLVLLLVHNQLWHEFISNGFAENGEHYYKTQGKVLDEHFGKGLFVHIAEPLSFWLIVSFTTISLIPHEKITFRIVTGLALLYYLLFVLFYVGTKAYDIHQGTFGNTNRVIAIGTSGTARVIGVALGSWLAVRFGIFSRLSTMLSRVVHKSQTR